MWRPVLFGPNRVGQVDFCVAAFSGATKVRYAWQANGKTIAKATSPVYWVPPSLLQKVLRCSVTATNANGSVSGTSTGARITLGRALDPVVGPVVKGPHLPGHAEWVSAGKWSPSAKYIKYQWYTGSTKISGATTSWFTVPDSYQGKTIHCLLIASTPGYYTRWYSTPGVKIT
jgi:hypothetical protein